MKELPLFAFNIWNIELCEIFASLCSEFSTPSILQVSENVAKKLDIELFTRHVNVLKDRYPGSIFLNLDHATDLSLVHQCIDNKWDMVMYDGSRLPLEENIRNTGNIVGYAHKNRVLVEGEIDPILRGSNMKVSDEPQKTDIANAARFIAETGVDYFAIGIGTFHGFNPDRIVTIDYELLERASKELPAHLVLHGGSGLTNDIFTRCFAMKIMKINISSEIRKVYHDTVLTVIQDRSFDIRLLKQHLAAAYKVFFMDKIQCLRDMK